MKRGFTLVEILVVTGILLLLVAVSYPVIISAKLSGKKAASISNLRQCGLVMSIYADENGGMSLLPVGDAADQMLAKAPTCDPNDYWRNGCSAPSSRPMIGSYAYVRHVKPFDSSQGWLEADQIHGSQSKQRTLLISIFYSSERIPANTKGFGHFYTSPYPTPILALKEDMSVQTVQIGSDYMVSSDWATLFLWQKK